MDLQPICGPPRCMALDFNTRTCHLNNLMQFGSGLRGSAARQQAPTRQTQKIARREKTDSLPGAFSSEQSSKTMSNLRYAGDIFELDRIYNKDAGFNKERVIIVVGTSLIAELLDRPRRTAA